MFLLQFRLKIGKRPIQEVNILLQGLIIVESLMQ